MRSPKSWRIAAIDQVGTIFLLRHRARRAGASFARLHDGVALSVSEVLLEGNRG